MQSSLPQRQDHLRVRYRALLESAWGRREIGPVRRLDAEPTASPTRNIGSRGRLPIGPLNV